MQGRGLVHGAVQGRILVSARAFTFAHGVDPATGQVTDIRSDIRGSNVRGRVLCYPFGKGSTTASSWFIETVRRGNAPAALLTEAVDLSAVIGSVMAGVFYGKKIPVLSGIPMARLSTIRPDATLSVDGKTGRVVIEA